MLQQLKRSLMIDGKLSNLFNINGKSALITGASSGIGEHFADTLNACGVQVMLAARRTDRLEQIAARLNSEGGNAKLVKLDVTDKSSVQVAFKETVVQFGKVDIVVNNAGIASQGQALDVTEQEWDEVLDTNLKGAWLVAQQGGLHMAANNNGGSIVNIASILGRRVMGGVAPYAVAKAALEHLTRVLAYEWAKFHIRVNAIAPGYVETDINRDYLNSPMGDKAKMKIPQRRFGKPSDLDGALLLLASEASSYMTGSTIVVDGGHLQSSM